MLYGNAQDPEKRVRVEVVLGEASITARVTDEGTGFDPASVPDPRTPQNLCKEGGRGCFSCASSWTRWSTTTGATP